MTSVWQILCDSPEIAVDVGVACDRIHLDAERVVSSEVVGTAIRLAKSHTRVAVATTVDVSLDQWVQLADTLNDTSPTADTTKHPAVVGWLGHHPIEALRDIGIISVNEVGSMVGVLALLNAQPEQPSAVNTRGLSKSDAMRLGTDAISSTKAALLQRGNNGLLELIDSATSNVLANIGSVPDTAHALNAIRTTSLGPRARVPRVEDVNMESVRNIMLGPARALSDPASKALLAHYDLPLSSDELCTTPSRAASEASRVGFPVRVTLASPDLRVWHHPDLVMDDLRSATQVRDAYRQLHATATLREKDARVLGVTVGSSTLAIAQLHLEMVPLDSGAVAATVGWVPTMGAEPTTITTTILPTTREGVERLLARLISAGAMRHPLAPDRQALVDPFGDVLLRLAAFVHDWHEYITDVVVHPLVLLVNGEFEIRQACVTVSDQFEESLAASHGA